MTKSARSLLDDESQKQRMNEAFAVGSDRFANALASQDLWDILDEAKDIRNKEKAHGGIAGEEQHASTHARLSNLLTKLGAHLGPSLSDVMLVRPGAGRYRRGVTYYDRADLLQGPHTIFLKKAVATLQKQPLEDTELYLFPTKDDPAPTVLHVEPFVRLRSSPAGAHNACYFFAELKNGSVEFISHHFEDAPRIEERDEELVELISELRVNEGGEMPDVR